MLFRSLAFAVLPTAEAVSQRVPSLRGATPRSNPFCRRTLPKPLGFCHTDFVLANARTGLTIIPRQRELTPNPCDNNNKQLSTTFFHRDPLDGGGV